MVRRAARRLVGVLPEVAILRERCQYTPAEVVVNGKSILNVLQPPDHRFWFPFQATDREGGVEYLPDVAKCELRLVTNGVWIATRDLSGAASRPPGFVARVSAPGLRKDLSQRDIVQDEEYHRVLADIVPVVERSAYTMTVRLITAWSAQGGAPVPAWALDTLPWELIREVRHRYHSVVTEPDGTAYLVTAKGEFLQRAPADACGWSSVTKVGGTPVVAAAATASGDLAVATDTGWLHLLGGEPWSRVNARHIASGKAEPVEEAPSLAAPPPRERIRAMWGVGKMLYAVGDAGVVLRGTFRGGERTWRRLDAGVFTDLTAAWGITRKCMFVAGRAGVLLRYDGKTWHRMQSPRADTDWVALWGTSAFEVFAAGSFHRGVTGGARRFELVSVIARFDGERWVEQALPEGIPRLTALWGSGADAVFAVGKRGLILRYDGATWTRFDHALDVDLESVGGSSPDDVYAVAADGSVLRYNGKRWRPTIPHLRGYRMSLRTLLERYGHQDVCALTPARDLATAADLMAQRRVHYGVVAPLAGEDRRALEAIVRRGVIPDSPP